MQRLVELLAVCPSCHQVKHIGRALVNHREEEAMRHLARVNGWTHAQAEDYLELAGDIWRVRNQVAWTLDLSHLETFSVGGKASG